MLGIRNQGWHGGHQVYGKVNNDFGMEEFYNPYELIRQGYFQTRKVQYSTTSNYTLNDWTSRNTSTYSDPDEILEVPIGDANRNEFFLIANRQKVSTYDKNMWGDTMRGDPYASLNDPNYGKGIYIYHAYPGSIGSGYQWQVPFDQECADGLFNWEYVGDLNPDWNCGQPVPYYRPLNVSYAKNDPSTLSAFGQTYGLDNRDGKSVNNYFLEGTVWKPYTSWFGIGSSPGCEQGMGTDKYWTNKAKNYCYSQYPYQVWTSREWQGDRWDAWNVGYNEVFSPYSSPSTYNWSDENSGIFIYLHSQVGTAANFKIYKVGELYTLDQILEFTPPSKPMGVVQDYYYPTSGPEDGLAYPRIRWNHNMEPDMLDSKDEKKYKIFRAKEDDMSTIPLNYVEIATITVPENSTPEYIDNTVNGECSLLPDVGVHIKYPARYRIQAIDIHTTPSVLSDFAAVVGIRVVPPNPGGEDQDRPGVEIQPELPREFALLQNYPNPFNPSTDIKFELPNDNFITIRIYNAIGEEVALLVNNEWKTTGRYNVKFDGSHLASGIYFYSITAGPFKDTKKMVLIK